MSAETDFRVAIPVPATQGGTGQVLYAIGDLLYADTTTSLSKLGDIATGNALLSGGVGVAPSWGKIALTTHVSGILPVANGGTSGATPAAARSGISALSKRAAMFAKIIGNTGSTAIASGATRTLQVTEIYDTDNLFSVSSGVITVGTGATGTWRIRGVVNFWGTNYSQAWVQRTNNTSAVIANGNSSYSLSTSGPYAVAQVTIEGRATVTDGDMIELQSVVNTTGTHLNYGGVNANAIEFFVVLEEE